MIEFLIIDNDSMTGDAIHSILSENDYTIHVATSADAAFSFLEKGSTDAVLVDITMTTSRGESLVAELSNVFRELPLIVLSSVTATDKLIQVLRIGIFEFLQKPINADLFRKTVSHVVETISNKRKQAEILAELQNTNISLRELAYFKDQVASQIVHDLRNKMSVFSSAAEMLDLYFLNEFPLDVQTEITQLKNSIERTVTLVDEVTNVYNISEPNQSLSIEPVDLSFAVREVCSLMNPISKKLAVTLHCDPRDELIIAADRGKIMRILENCISNALVFTPPGGRVFVSITEETVDSCPYACIHVQDSGVGMQRDEVRSIFQMYYRIRNTSPHGIEGTGLGLWIVKSLVKNHHGKIKVMTKPGEGTKLSIMLPMHGNP